MSVIAANIAKMVDMLPENDQHLAHELIKKLVLAWDPDFTRVTQEEALELKEAEESGFISEKEIDWNNLKKYAE